MRAFLVALLLTAAACSPPAATPPAAEEKAAAPAEPAPPAVDLGPYTNQWDSSEMTHFNHTLRAATPGQHAVTLSSATTIGGTETVAVYPADASGERDGPRLMFVVATTGGTERVAQLDIPEAGLPVRVSVENLSGRQSAGSYTLTVAP